MNYNYTNQSNSYNIPYQLRLLFIINLAVFILLSICDIIDPSLTSKVYTTFGLVPENFFSNFYLWQPFTYLFIHGSEMHIFFNMLVLWFLGVSVINKLGGKEFLRFYLYTGFGAGIITLAVNWFLAGWSPIKAVTPTVGASGSIYGVLLAYSMLFPNRRLYLYFLFPIKSKWLVIFAASYSLFAFLSGSSSGTSHIAHLSGIVVGYVYFKKNIFSIIPKFRIKFVNKNNSKEKEAFSQYYSILDKLNEVGWDGLNDYEQGKVIEYHELVKKKEPPN